jgi:ribosomal protein S18 acetylase RimI-like enzyme
VTAFVIREVDVADSELIAELVSELGYPTSVSQMQGRLQAILNDHDYDTLVGCDGGRVVGFIGTRSGPIYEHEGLYGQIMALAVASSYQRRGVGRALMRSAESRLLERGVTVLIVTSGNHRAGAHAFYESCGYSFTGRRYRKSPGTSS